MCIGSIGVNSGDVFTAFIEEVELQTRCVSLLSRGATYEPIVGAFGLTRCRDILTGFGFEVSTVVPINGYVTNKLKGVHVLAVVFNHVGSHLQRTVHRYVQRQLACNGRLHFGMVLWIVLTHIHFKYTWREVHRATLQSCKRKNGSMVYVIAFASIEFGTACRLVADEVWPCTAESCGANGLVCINHDTVTSGFFHSV